MALQWITWIQSFNTPFLDVFFELITMLGETYFYIVVLGFFYWCISKEGVKDLVMVLTLSSVVNAVLKEWVNTPRPYLVENIRALRTETANGSSF
ncbi:MAG TPA: PA-phosphatase, partial [Clostridiales bacterium UBA8960]|nr:PA-phosphatase [Clostridiales bacterium UBA8960]